MRYKIEEKLANGDAYVVIEREDGSTYGQNVSMQGVKTASDLDLRVSELYQASQALEKQAAEPPAEGSQVLDEFIGQTRLGVSTKGAAAIAALDRQQSVAELARLIDNGDTAGALRAIQRLL